MKKRPSSNAEALWRSHDLAWRHPADVVSQWAGASAVDPRLVSCRATGAWWDILESAKITLLVTREYEHLVMALSVGEKGPRVSFVPIPHPSGLAVNRARAAVSIASTRNPNQVVVFEPAGAAMARLDLPRAEPERAPLLPVTATFYPGALYLHDLVFLGDRLHGTAVGQNAIVRLRGDGRHEPVWWPRCIDGPNGPLFGRNYLQLNSIAAGATLERSYFTASTERPSGRRPGHRHFAVDGRGVVFSGATREPMVRGLTRPHSARIHDKRVWVANSGYGQLGVCAADRFEPVVTFPGWTRGLCFRDEVAFVGTSRVLPRFSHYAPGLRVERAVCGVHAVDVKSGRVLGGLVWPDGNQIFACEWIPSSVSAGFPFAAHGPRAAARARRLFYAFSRAAE